MFPREGGGGVLVQSLDINIDKFYFSKGGKGICISVPEKTYTQFVCFVWFESLRHINNLSVKQGRVFLGWTSTKLG